MAECREHPVGHHDSPAAALGGAASAPQRLAARESSGGLQFGWRGGNAALTTGLAGRRGLGARPPRSVACCMFSFPWSTSADLVAYAVRTNGSGCWIFCHFRLSRSNHPAAAAALLHNQPA